jgi:FtsP/CotA-like multicopper oxidase with cupredoxin domain
VTIPAFRTGTFLAALLFGTASRCVAQQPAQTTVIANDNTRSSGALVGNVVTVRLVAGHALWRPEEGEGPGLDVAAFGEDGGPLLIPGPLVRVSEGTEVVVQVRNALADSLEVHGLVSHPAAEDAVVVVPAGETRDVRFSAGSPGTYSYWATTANRSLADRKGFESQLGGAFVVDPRGSATSDRVFVITGWRDGNRARERGINELPPRFVFAINGFSWPHTERLDERVGQPVQWRVVNLTGDVHSMHLHGFYFTVQAIGSGLRETAYRPAEYRTVVTEFMDAGGTMQMAWTPERPGNWLFHCHLTDHVSSALRFWKPAAADEHAGHATHDARTDMAGLVMGIRVSGEAAVLPTPSAVAQRLTLLMRKQPGYWHPEDAYGFALESGRSDIQPQSVGVPGPLLVLHRGEPVEITLKNELPEATSIHWHGIEMDSYFDGVPGWSGSSQSTTPAIEPGGTFRVRFTPPRAGTFIYHTHAEDTRQLASGLYGAIVVLEPGEHFDPARDHVVLLGMEGPKNPSPQVYERFPVVVNGSRATQLTLKAGAPNRLRLINITTSFYALNVSLIGGNQPIPWRPVAKDGADLPASQQIVRPALAQQVSVGETFDFIVGPLQAGRMWMDLRRGSGEWVQQVSVRVEP